MLTLATLPDDALGTIMHFLDGPALEALSETSRRLRTFTAASRAIWIQALQSVYLARGAAPPDLRVLFSLPTKELRRRTTQSHRALHNLSRRAPHPSRIRRLPPEVPLTGLVGTIISFFVCPGGEYVFVAENDVDWGSIVLWELPSAAPARAVARLDFELPLCCVDVQLAEDGRALDIVISVEDVAVQQCYAHLVFRIDIPGSCSQSSTCRFVQMAELRNDKMPRYVSMYEDWVALNVGQGELIFWAWKSGERVHVVVDDAVPESAEGWAIHFCYPNAFVFDTGPGIMRCYTLPPSTPIDKPSADDSPRVTAYTLSATLTQSLPEVWRSNMSLWMLGTLLPLPPDLQHSTFAIVHAGIADGKLLHCIMPDLRFADTAVEDSKWPFCLSHPLPNRISDSARVVHVATLGDVLITLVDDGPDGGLHAFLTPWNDVGADAAVVDLETPARRTQGFRKLLDACLAGHSDVGVSPVAVDAISGHVILVVAKEDATRGTEFLVADFAE